MLLPTILLLAGSPKVHACDTGTVRDSAFSSARDNYWIGMAFDKSDSDSQKRYDELSTWLAEHGNALNIKIEQILPDDAMYLRLRYGVTTPPTEFPITYFAGHHPAAPRPVTFFEWTPAPEITLFENLKANSVFASIRKNTTEHWATVLYARGTGQNKQKEVSTVVEEWKRSHAPGVALIELDHQNPEHEFLCAVTGIKEEGEDWVGVVFGKGRLLTPVLVGDAISSRELDRMLNRLTIPCTCLQAETVFGFDLPMFWDTGQEKAYAQLAAPVGYMEMTLDDKLDSIMTEMPSGEKSINTVALLALMTLGLIVVVILSFMLLRLRKQP